MDLHKKNTVITGATSGIGLEFAKYFIERGAEVLLVGRDFMKFDQIFKAKHNEGITKIRADLGKTKDLYMLVQKINELYDEVAFLIHCAGTIHQSPVISSQLEDLDKQYTVNLRAPYYITRQLLKKLIKAKGTLIFMNSTGSLEIKKNNSLYAATKAGLRIFVDILRKELEDTDLKVIQVFPGATDTPMQEKIQKEAGKMYDSSHYIPAYEITQTVMEALGNSRHSIISDLIIRNKPQ